MCQAILIPQRIIANKRTEPNTQGRTIKLYAENADIIELLFHKIYGSRGDVLISNVRLFSLLFLLDWTAAIHDKEVKSVTRTGRWLRGPASPYPRDYYEYLVNQGVFENKEDEEVWQAKRRCLFCVNFEGEENEHFSAAAEEAAIRVGRLIQQIGRDHNVDFSGRHEYDLPEDGKFQKIDTRILELIYSLDPFLKSGIKFDDDLNMLHYAKKHRETFLLTPTACSR